MVRYGEPRAPGAARLQVRFEFRYSFLLRGFDLLVRIECRGVCCDVDLVRSVKVGGAERDCRCVSYSYMEEVRRRQNSVLGGCVCNRVSRLMSVPWPDGACHNPNLTTSPTLTLPVWWSSNMLLARCSSLSCSLRDWESRKNEERGSAQPASGIWAREYERGVSSISGELTMFGSVCGWQLR